MDHHEDECLSKGAQSPTTTYAPWCRGLINYPTQGQRPLLPRDTTKRGNKAPRHPKHKGKATKPSPGATDTWREAPVTNNWTKTPSGSYPRGQGGLPQSRGSNGHKNNTEERQTHGQGNRAASSVRRNCLGNNKRIQK